MEQSTTPEKPVKKRRSIGKTIFILLLLAVAGYGAWTLYDLYLTPDHNIRQIYLIPRTASVIIQTNDPVGDWKRFSASEPWQGLKKAESFAEVSASVDGLDSLIRENNTLFSAVGKREVMISLHKTRTGAWDFLAVVDLQKMSKMNTLKENIEQFFKVSGFTVTNRRYKGVNITESRDPKTLDILYTAFVDNHFLASYNTRLVESSIDEREDPVIGLSDHFLEVEKIVSGKGLCRIYVNYAYLPQFLSIYMGRNEWVDMLSKSMTYGGLYVLSQKDKLEVTGHMVLGEEPDPYVEALLNSGSHRMGAHEILSARTALYANVGFGNTATFVKELEKALSLHDKQAYETYRSSRTKLEKYFSISLQENFLDWMDGEFAIAQSEPGLLGREAEQILAIRARNIKEAHKNMDLIEKRIGNRSPVSVKTTNYKTFEIKYIELGGFFRLFFGKLFDSFEKPYYTYVGDYVVFSNKVTSLLSFLEDYEQKNLMQGEEGFQKAYAQVSPNSTIFAYTDMRKFFPLLRPMLSAETWSDMQSNREVLFSFPWWTFQVVSSARQNVSLQLTLNYQPYVAEPVAAEQPSDSLAVAEPLEDHEQTEKEIMSELKRFYVENFEGNVLREYYPEGQLQSESEVKAGKRNGRYREFYESGKLKARGEYKANKPRGTWKYYTEEGKLERKERF